MKNFLQKFLIVSVGILEWISQVILERIPYRILESIPVEMPDGMTGGILLEIIE